MTDLRDQLADFEAAARRLLTQPPPRLRLVYARPATCHPRRPLYARGLCQTCYRIDYTGGTLANVRRIRRRVDFVADYVLLRSEGHTRAQIADRMGMSIGALNKAYLRAVRAGDLTPDRRTA